MLCMMVCLNLTLPEGSFVGRFADDFAVAATVRNTEMIQIIGNEFMRRISIWLQDAGLTLAL